MTSITTARSHRARRRLSRAVLYLLAIVVLAIILIPLAYAVIGGFRTSSQLVSDPVGLPNPWVITNYIDQLLNTAFWRQIWNSFFIAVVTTLLVLPAASLASYAIARYRFRGKEVIYTFFTLGLLFPIAVAVIPLFITLRQANLLNNPFGVALPQAAFALPLAVVIFRPFFQSIPRDLFESAALDGCGPLRTYWSIVLPLSRPVLATIAILAVVASWNAFILPLLILTEPTQWTLPIGVNNVSAQFSTDYAVVLAYATLAMIPALAFYFLFQKQIVGGLTAGAVK
ncbi:MAG: carbohydrate ABC transporter permease [Anaerolineales bacterium]|nr:carbohydrate ABC transporter permease [Anaerolineales bacterium]